jgi:HAE1 family hydrophobic/amphiphilic exporter-1
MQPAVAAGLARGASTMQIVEFATRRRVTILMMTLAVVLFGFVSLSRLKLNLLPDLSYPTLTVRTDLPGAAPLELETLLTRPIEEAVGIIRNVRQVRSVSRAGQADVILEFAWGTDMDLAGIDVREKIDLLQLPIEASRPILLRFDPRPSRSCGSRSSIPTSTQSPARRMPAASTG